MVIPCHSPSLYGKKDAVFQDAHAIPGLAVAGLPTPGQHGLGLALARRGQVAEAPGAREVAEGGDLSCSCW